MRAGDRSGLAVMISIALASMTMRSLTVDGSYLILAWLMIGLIGGISIVLRRLWLGGGTVLATQVLVWLLYSLGLGLVSPSTGSPWYARYTELWAAGIDHMRTQTSPMEPNDGTTLIFVTVIGLILIMTDLLVSGIARPAWAIAPPATLFLATSLGSGTDTGVVNFLLIALGYLGILLAEDINSTARWTQGLARDSAQGFGETTPVVWRATAYLAAPALVATIVLAVALPTLPLRMGIGSGSGGDRLQLTDPTLDLRRNLQQPADRVVIEYQTDASDGVYLRMASLSKFSEAGWANAPVHMGSGHQLSTVPGLGVAPKRQHRTDIRVRDFASQYLPLPYAPRSHDAPGNWRYDPQSLVVVNAEDRAEDLRRLEYSVVSTEIEPSAADLADAGLGTPVDAKVTTEVPDNLPPRFQELADKVVTNANAETPAAQAAAIQNYLRSGQFAYSTEPLPGNGYEALENFLFVDRQGYCEQFAASMALMARLVGIPTRVAVGFLPGEEVDDSSWRVTAQKMHAWPELFFSGWGWVRFEPTPPVQTGEAPPWTLQPEEDPADDPTAAPSASESAAPPATDPRDPHAETPVTADETNPTGWTRTLLWSGAGLVLLLILATPATIRVRRRSQRMNDDGAAEEQVENAWAEIRDTVVDHGGAWPTGSPRAIGQEISSRLDTEEAASMGRVATLVERARYARTLTHTDATTELPAVTQEIRHAIAAPVGPVRRLLAVVLPRSLFPRWPGRGV